VYPLGLQLAVQASDHLNAGTSSRRSAEKAAGGHPELSDDIWVYSKTPWDDAMNCNAGKDPATTGKKFGLTTVPVTPGDLDSLSRRYARSLILPGPELATRSIRLLDGPKKAVGPLSE